MIYGYCRVSTKRQVIKRQIENINDYARQHDITSVSIYSEAFTGTTTERPEWKKLLGVVEKGDTIIFDSVSRMSRNAEEGVQQYFELYEKGIELIFLNEMTISTATYSKSIERQIENISTGDEKSEKFINGMLDLLNNFIKDLAQEQIYQAFIQSEKEVKDIQKRTKDGMKAKKSGAKISKARTGKTYETEKSKEIKKMILKHSKEFNGTLKDKEVIDMIRGKLKKCSTQTYYRYKQELMNSDEQLKGQQTFEV